MLASLGLSGCSFSPETELPAETPPHADPGSPPAPAPARDALAGIRAIQYNVGNGGSGCPPKLPGGPGKRRLNSPADIARIRDLIAAERPDIIFLQEVLSGYPQLVDPVNPLLPAGYDGQCPLVANEGNGMVCVAWKQATFRLEQPGACRGRFMDLKGKKEIKVSDLANLDPRTPGNQVSGGMVSCELIFNDPVANGDSSSGAGGARIERVVAVSTYVADKSRAKISDWVWQAAQGPGAPLAAVVGGDFQSATPEYPKPFGAVFGQHVKGYGRWAPAKTFYGSYIDGKPATATTQTFEVCGVKVKRSQTDHLFANFGKLVDHASCHGSACTLPPACTSCDHPAIAGALGF